MLEALARQLPPCGPVPRFRLPEDGLVDALAPASPWLDRLEDARGVLLATRALWLGCIAAGMPPDPRAQHVVNLCRAYLEAWLARARVKGSPEYAIWLAIYSSTPDIMLLWLYHTLEWLF